MQKKSFFIRVAVILILVAMLVPTLCIRISNEKENNDVVFALNYNNAEMVLSTDEFNASLKDNKKIGVNTLFVAEESVNSLINSGFVTGIKYNVLSHKYDDESEEILKLFANDKKIHNDSYVLLTKRPESKAYLSKWIPAKFAADEFVKKTTPLGADVYLIYEGVMDAWKLTTGFDEKKIENAHKQGFDIALSMMLGGFSNTKYVDYITEIVEKYNVKFINLKEDYNNEDKSKDAKKNYNEICKLIEDKKLRLIVTENQDHLSNQKPIGYDALVKSAGGRILRGYETVDWGSEKPVETRYQQIVNSVIDRNIRFVVINQLVSGVDTFEEKSNKTNKASETCIKKLESIGYDTQSYDNEFDYNVNRRFVSSVAMIIMIIMGLTILEILFNKNFGKLRILAVVAAVLSIGFTALAPEKVVLLYSTLYALVAPCFALTVMYYSVNMMRDRFSWLVLLLCTVVISAVTLVVCGTVLATLLSGLDYYTNTLIFHGTKITLTLPPVFGAVAFCLMFMNKKDSFLSKTIDVLKADIKVYWVLLAGVLGAVGYIYILRSGNVTSISGVETLLRNSITELLTARPRTKEFLIGWPCLVLFVYYFKNTELKLLQWGFATGAAILFASVINSFCHVFTGVLTIYSRVLNGMLVGAVVCVFVLVINAVIVRIVKFVTARFFKKSIAE